MLHAGSWLQTFNLCKTFECTHLKFTVSGQSMNPTHAQVQCSPASVGVTQSLLQQCIDATSLTIIEKDKTGNLAIPPKDKRVKHLALELKNVVPYDLHAH